MATQSQIDGTVPADGIKVDKGLLRKNFTTAQSEMTRSLRAGRPTYSYAFGKIPLISTTP